jgi:hypothetical protein
MNLETAREIIVGTLLPIALQRAVPSQKKH